jgi:hypothetical protein
MNSTNVSLPIDMGHYKFKVGDIVTVVSSGQWHPTWVGVPMKIQHMWRSSSGVSCDLHSSFGSLIFNQDYLQYHENEIVSRVLNKYLDGEV